MANRFPLIVDSSNQNIKELPDGDSLLLGDSEKLLLGDGTDLQLYHDGSNSYLANSTGALKLATESSGIAITIGHTTSETTIGDNLVVTGDLSIGGVTLPETIADTVGAMVTSNTESGITVAYQDADNTLDFTIGTLNQNTTGSAATLTTARTIGGTSFDGSANIAVGLAATATALATARTIGGTSFDGTANIAVGLADTATALATSRTIHGVGFDGTANIDLSEVISDTVGAMFSSNTETGIVATYQDADNTIDLVIGDDVIVQSMIADDAIDSQHYVDGSIDLAHMSVNSIDSDQYVDGSIDTAHIGDDQVTGAKIENAVTIATSATSPLVVATTSARITQVAITSSSNAVAWNSVTAANAYHVTTENTTFSAPSNSVEGAVISVELAQGGTPRTIAWNTVFEFAASTAPTVTATANKTDIFTFRYNGSVWQEIGRVQNMAQT